MVVSGNGDAKKLQIYNYYGKQFEKSGDAKFKQAQEYTKTCQKVLIIHISVQKKKNWIYDGHLKANTQREFSADCQK